MSEVAEIIQECAELRGVGSIPQRSVDEFQHFGMSVLFADEIDGFNSDLQDDYYQMVMKSDTIEEGLANAFHIHCKEKYDPVKIKQQEIEGCKRNIERNMKHLEKLERELNYE